MPTGSGPLPRGPRLAVDVGNVRVGLAASDPDGLLATPVETLARDLRTDGSWGSDLERIATEVRDRGAAVVYVGLPRLLSGEQGSAATGARAYAEQLADGIAPVPVRMVDERLTTVSAHQALRASGREGRTHRSVIDQAAAVIILQSALDVERASGQRSGELIES
ncbi:Holliday junction resolvase RuvX [Paraoerskovia sediminicola]|uniref:Holliday junction resolvase RuvX n=1 Tax=Paraoerskovia sediminicola TaxID=1138587 RepID=UPI00257248A3|nr:Holliday junction resolvase RuvX [Paraoerskovia sediminicola]